MSKVRWLVGLGLLGLVGLGCYHPALPPAPPRPEADGSEPLTKPVVAPLSRPAYSLSNFSEQTLPETHSFAYVARQTTMRMLSSAIDSAMSDLMADPALRGNILGPPTMVYLGATSSLDSAFELQVGFAVTSRYSPARDIRVEPLPAMHCLTVDFTGSLSAIDKAYDKLLPAAEARKLTRTEEIREIYYNWEGPASDNNQVRVAVGVK